MMSHSSSKCVYSGFCSWWAIIHCAISEPPRLTMPVTRFVVSGRYSQQHAGVDGHVVDALLGLVLDHVEHLLRRHVVDVLDVLDRPGRSARCRSGPGEASMIAWRMASMLPPVDRSMTVSAPRWTAVCSFSSSSSTSLVTAELPMLALILQADATPMRHRLEPLARGASCWPG